MVCRYGIVQLDHSRRTLKDSGTSREESRHSGASVANYNRARYAVIAACMYMICAMLLMISKSVPARQVYLLLLMISRHARVLPR